MRIAPNAKYQRVLGDLYSLYGWLLTVTDSQQQLSPRASGQAALHVLLSLL